MPRKPPKNNQPDLALQQFQEGLNMVVSHPLFTPLAHHSTVMRSGNNRCPPEAWAVVTNNGLIYPHPTRRGQPEEWAYVLAHCMLHLGFGHLVEKQQPLAWNAACDLLIDRFLKTLKWGRAPAGFICDFDLAGNDEERLYENLCEQPELLAGYHGDLLFEPLRQWRNAPSWQDALGVGLSAAVSSAVDVAGGLINSIDSFMPRQTPAQRARSWFIGSYPLLGALASAFKIIEHTPTCHQLEITVAAVDMERQEIYINPAAGLNEAECRFVMAHELLHVGLRHDVRRQGRDPYLWNVACDYVINGWLVEMGIGHLPHIGGLYDPALKGESAESIYDMMTTDLRRYRKLATLRGVGLSDMLEPRLPDWWTQGDGTDLDAFYRQCLAQGLVYHDDFGRGMLPGNLIEEIRALSQPPVPWDVELARWFDEHFPSQAQQRSYARPSRRQSSTPDIPRPRYVPNEQYDEARTFGVVLDTSGSMNTELLAKALGAIASYSIAHDVPAVRVVFCDAITYDQGYMQPENIADSVRVRGRGGTILQPGITLLETATDFPKDGPILIITDGLCDRFQVHREHAFILPRGRNLPFIPRGPVFRITD